MQFIDLQEQRRRYEPAISDRIQAVLEHGQFIMGPEIAELETALAEYVGVPFCVSVASGTHSLEIALRSLDVGPGDEVITVPFTWISSAEVISLVGATCVFVDIDRDTFCIDVDQVAKAITPRTKAIIPVSLFGQMPDLEKLAAVAAAARIAVIEDAAQSFGSTRHGRRSCGVTTIGSTSFFPAKPLGCYGDGGALFCTDNALAEKMRAIRTHGGLRRHHHPYIGTNSRLDTLQAAILLAKWPHFPAEIQARGEIGARYSEHLRPYVRVPEVAAGNTHVYAQYTIRSSRRDQLARVLRDAGVPTGVYYPKCVHEQPAFTSCGKRRGDFPVAEAAAEQVLSLPMHPFLAPEDQQQIVRIIQRFVESHESTMADSVS